MDIRSSFSEYFIASSHNSFLNDVQLLTCSRSSAVKMTLEKGARMIELDIFFDSNAGNVLVSHGRKMKKFNLFCSYPISLEDACETICEFITPETSPVFLSLEVNIGYSPEAQKVTADILQSSLGKLLIPGKLDLREACPEDYFGKVILCSGHGTVSGGPLEALINVDFGREGYLYNRSCGTILKNNESYKNMIRNSYVIRSYPPNKFLSRNFDPLPLMNLGVQFIAMNYQNRDSHMRTYEKVFETFGDSKLVGYVRKSEIIGDGKKLS